MREMFENVPRKTRERVKFWLETAFVCSDARKAAEDLARFRASLETQEEKDYLDFSFDVMMERIKKGE